MRDPTARIQTGGGGSIVGTTTTESFTAIQNAVAAAAASFAAPTPTQTFSQQIQNSTTITGNGGQNVILINNQINLNNGANLTISGGSSDTFVFNIAQGQNIQLQNGSSIVLSGVSPSQVVFNFLGNGGNVQVQSNNQGTSNTAGIFLDPLGQINIQGGTHNSVFISGKQIQLRNAQVAVPVCGVVPPALPATCALTYPYGSAPALTSVQFNESGVLQAFATGPASGSMPMQIRAWFSDEHAPLLGAREVQVISSGGTTATIDYPFNTYVPSTMGLYNATSPLAVGDTALTTSLGGNAVSYAGVDTALQSSSYNFGVGTVNGAPDSKITGRPLWPSLFLTDLTANANSTAGDWQMGNTNGIPPNGIYGIWKGAVVVVDESKVPTVMSVINRCRSGPEQQWEWHPSRHT